MSPETPTPDLTPEQLLSDPAYIEQWGMHFHRAAQAVAEQMFNLSGKDYDDFFALYSQEIARRRAKYGDARYNLFATGPGLTGGGHTHPWTAADFPGDDAVLGPNPNSLESQLRLRFPTAFSGLAPFVPPSQQEGA